VCCQQQGYFHAPSKSTWLNAGQPRAAKSCCCRRRCRCNCGWAPTAAPSPHMSWCHSVLYSRTQCRTVGLSAAEYSMLPPPLPTAPSTAAPAATSNTCPDAAAALVNSFQNTAICCQCGDGLVTGPHPICPAATAEHVLWRCCCCCCSGQALLLHCSALCSAATAKHGGSTAAAAAALAAPPAALQHPKQPKPPSLNVAAGQLGLLLQTHLDHILL
jgi:hypothetical protein